MTNALVLDRLTSLADFTRSRLLLALDQHELTVGELCTVVQLPQSTVSRHLKTLGDDGWLVSRAEGTSRFYRLSPSLDESARGLWEIVRQDVSRHGMAQEDAQRTDAVLRSRRDASREFFSSAATRWDSLRRELYGERIDQSSLLGLLDSRWAVGDLGCGTGALSAFLAAHVGRVIAVDGSEHMLEAASARLQRAANVEIRAGDLEKLPVETESLDVGFLTLVLHYVTEPPRALCEAFRVLRPGGRLIVVDMLPHGREEYRVEMGHLWQGFAVEQFVSWMREAGFERTRLFPLAVDERARGPALFMACGVKPMHASNAGAPNKSSSSEEES
jgi:ArsR family transcriptional regulator